MQNKFKVLQNISENIRINNASRDFIEFFITEVCAASNKKIVFINQGLPQSRVKKNFSFLNKNLVIKFIEEAEEIYSLKAQNIHELAEQNKAIHEVLNEEFDVLFLDYKMLLKKVPTRDFFKEKTTLKVNERFGHLKLLNTLFEYGFLRCDTVFDFGEFAVRGFIIDVCTLDGFFRIEFDGEVISSICKFNSETQRKIQNGNTAELEIFKIKQISLSQNWELEAKKLAIEIGVDDPSLAISDISNFGSIGLCNFLPLFYKEMECIVNFLPKDIIFITFSNLETTLEFFEENLKNLHSLYKKQGRGFLETSFLLLKKDDIIPKITPKLELFLY